MTIAPSSPSQPCSQALVSDALTKSMNQQLPWVGRVFFYMPLMHAEHLALQDECVRRFTQLHADAPESLKADLVATSSFQKATATSLRGLAASPTATPCSGEPARRRKKNS